MLRCKFCPYGYNSQSQCCSYFHDLKSFSVSFDNNHLGPTPAGELTCNQTLVSAKGVWLLYVAQLLADWWWTPGFGQPPVLPSAFANSIGVCCVILPRELYWLRCRVYVSKMLAAVDGPRSVMMVSIVLARWQIWTNTLPGDCAGICGDLMKGCVFNFEIALHSFKSLIIVF